MTLRLLLRGAAVAAVAFLVTGLWLPVPPASACGAMYATPIPSVSGCSEGAALAGAALVGSVAVVTLLARLLVSGRLPGPTGVAGLSPEQLDDYLASVARTAVDAAAAAGGSATTAVRGTRNVEIIAEFDERAPGETRPFAPTWRLEPDTDYAVVDRVDLRRNPAEVGQYRGTFSTDATGRIAEARLVSGSCDPFGGARRWGPINPVTGTPWNREGRPHRVMLPRSNGSVLNPDLNHLMPDVVYHVDGRFHFVTDGQRRVRLTWADRVEVVDPELRPERNKGVTSKVGRLGGPGFDGGHILARELGGPGERVNVAPMNELLNRPQQGSTVETNYRSLEIEIARLAADHDVTVATAHHYPSPGARVPSDVTVGLIVDGEPWPTVYSYANTPDASC